MSWKTWTLSQWIGRLVEEAVYGLIFLSSSPRAIASLAIGIVTWVVALAGAGLYYGTVYALWPLVVGIPLARRVLPYLLLTPWAAVLGAWRAVRFCLRLLSPDYRAERREGAAFARWSAMSPTALEAVAAHLAIVRQSGSLLDAQAVRLVEEARWAMDGRTQGELLARCACHPELEKAAEAALKEINQSLGNPKPDTVETVRALWRAAWRYREAEQAAELAELRRTECERLSPAERFERWRRVGLFGGVAAFALGLLYAYPLQTLALGGVGLVLAGVTLAAKMADAVKAVQSTSNKESENGRVLPLLPDRRRPVRSL